MKETQGRTLGPAGLRYADAKKSAGLSKVRNPDANGHVWPHFLLQYDKMCVMIDRTVMAAWRTGLSASTVRRRAREKDATTMDKKQPPDLGDATSHQSQCIAIDD